MKNTWILVGMALFLFSGGNIFGKEPEGDSLKRLGFSKIRAKTTASVLEYEFFENGQLLSYEYLNDGGYSGPDIEGSVYFPKFRIDSLFWELDGRNLIIYTGNVRRESEVRIKGDRVDCFELTWFKVDEIQFWKEFQKYKNELIKSTAKGGKPKVKSTNFVW